VNELNGSYELVANTPIGEQRMTLTVEVSGATFSGTATGGLGSADVTGTALDNTLSWQQAITVPMPMKLDCTATIDGDKVEGKFDTGAFGAFQVKGTRIS